MPRSQSGESRAEEVPVPTMVEPFDPTGEDRVTASPSPANCWETLWDQSV